MKVKNARRVQISFNITAQIKDPLSYMTFFPIKYTSPSKHLTPFTASSNNLTTTLTSVLPSVLKDSFKVTQTPLRIGRGLTLVRRVNHSTVVSIDDVDEFVWVFNRGFGRKSQIKNVVNDKKEEDTNNKNNNNNNKPYRLQHIPYPPIEYKRMDDYIRIDEILVRYDQEGMDEKDMLGGAFECGRCGEGFDGVVKDEENNDTRKSTGYTQKEKNDMISILAIGLALLIFFGSIFIFCCCQLRNKNKKASSNKLFYSLEDPSIRKTKDDDNKSRKGKKKSSVRHTSEDDKEPFLK
jgi:hypothetical protein